MLGTIESQERNDFLDRPDGGPGIAGMRIMVVDDSPDSRLLTERQLRRGGFSDLTLIDSAEEALRQLGVGGMPSVQADLILMDLMMPGINGIEACRRIRQEPHLADVPILMVTVCDAGDELDTAFSAGASDYIQKPCSRTVLLARVGHALRLKQEIDCRKARERELLEIARQLEIANAALRRLAHLDGLTEIPNRRSFDETLAWEWRRVERSGGKVALLLVDIDHFKQYNDRYGHAAGDECLREVARVLNESNARPGDFAARYGGEEFAVILPETTVSGAAHVGDRLRGAVAALRLSVAGETDLAQVTISVGVAAVHPGSATTPAALIEAADRALYSAKAQGRNRVVTAP